MMMKNILGTILGAMLICSCNSFVKIDDRPYFAPEIALSKLHESTIQYDATRFAGINLIIRNDLDSDIFLKFAPRTDFVTNSIITDKSVRLPDDDERYRLIDEQFNGIFHPMKYAETYLYVWSGNTGFHHLYSPQLSLEKSYFPITYYHCNDKGFYTKTIRIIEANKAPEDTARKLADPQR